LENIYPSYLRYIYLFDSITLIFFIRDLIVIVDQVVPKMKSDERGYLDYCDAFERVPTVFGVVFNPRQGGGDDRIPFKRAHSPLRFFSFSTPFSEDEVVDYLRLQKDESTREEGVNISFVNQLLESYEKSSGSTEREQKEEEERTRRVENERKERYAREDKERQERYDKEDKERRERYDKEDKERQERYEKDGKEREERNSKRRDAEREEMNEIYDQQREDNEERIIINREDREIEEDYERMVIVDENSRVRYEI